MKLRIWEARSSQWMESYSVHMINAGVTINDLFNTQNLVFEQFTGMIDSNGVEIYEGDIVRDSWKENQPYGYCPEEWRDRESTYAIVYRAPSFVFETHGGSQTCIEDFNRVVIGNIHENPELSK